MKMLIPLAAAFLIAAAPASAQSATPALGEVVVDLVQQIRHDRHWSGDRGWRENRRWHDDRHWRGHKHERRPAHSNYRGRPPHSYHQGPPPHARGNKHWNQRSHRHSHRPRYHVPAPGGLHFHFSFPD